MDGGAKSNEGFELGDAEKDIFTKVLFVGHAVLLGFGLGFHGDEINGADANAVKVGEELNGVANCIE